MGWKFYHRYEIASDSFALYLRHTDHNGRRSLVKPFELELLTPGSPYAGLPSMGVQPGSWETDTSPLEDVRGFLQAAMDQAWEIGLRPTGHTDNSSELAAVRFHLEDMRTLAKVK